jgi:ABC-type molybdenum transport system ATPase subunit/photorepair protein PhrA
MTRRITPASYVKEPAIALLDRAITAVHSRDVKSLRNSLRALTDFLTGQQLIRIATYHEREHGIVPRDREVA